MRTSLLKTMRPDLRRRNYSNMRLDLAPDLVLARRINPSVVNESSASVHAPEMVPDSALNKNAPEAIKSVD